MSIKSVEKTLVDGKYSFNDIYDVSKLIELFTLFHETTGFIATIVSYKKHEPLISVGTRNICLNFHHTNEISKSACFRLSRNILPVMNENDTFQLHQCSNGLYEMMSPVSIDGVDIAVLFTGQVLLGKPNLVFFRERAKELGFDEKSYIKSLKDVPIVSLEMLQNAQTFLHKTITILGEDGLNNLKIKAYSKALEDSESRFRSITEQLNDVIYLTDDQGTIIYISPAVESVFGFSSEEMINKKFLYFLHEDEISYALEQFSKAISDLSQKNIFELKMKHKTKGYFIGELSYRLTWFDNRKCTIGTIRDITEFKKVNDALITSEINSGLYMTISQ